MLSNDLMQKAQTIHQLVNEESSSHVNSRYAREDDEIDLRELLLTLWRGRKILFCSIAFSATLALGYALTAPQWWASKAIITLPTVTDISNFLQLTKKYQFLFEAQSNAEGAIQINQEYAALSQPNLIFKRFIEKFNSQENKQLFYQALSENEKTQLLLTDNKSTAQKKAWEKFADKITAKMKAKDQADNIELQTEAHTAQSSFNLLTNYIDFTNQQVNQVLYKDFLSFIQLKQVELEQQINVQTIVAKQALNIELQQTAEALKIAKAAKITRPLENINHKDLFAFSIGSDALEQKMNVLTKIENLAIFNPDIYQSAQKLATLNQAIPALASTQLFKYLQRPEQPENRNSPKRALIVVLGVMLGGMLGVCIVLMRQLWKTKNN